MEDVSVNISAIANEIQRIFSLQQHNSQHIGLTSYQERIEKLRKLQDLILRNREQIKDAVYRDFKKAPQEVDLTEIYTLVSEIKYTIKHLKSWMKPRRVSNTIATLGARSKVIYQPKGVCLILSPWNYPFQLSLGPLISAIAAGNCVMMKPSEFSPHTSDLIKLLLHRVFKEDEVRVFEGDHTVAQLLLKLPFNHIYFTGSSQVGKIIMAEAAKHLASVTLELGGKSPVIIDQNADLDVAARRIIWGKLINAGQTCIAPDYVLVPKIQKEAFLNKAIQAVQELYGPIEGMIDNPDYCRIISSRHFQRIKALLEGSVHQGAQVVLGGVTKEEDHYISPTIIGAVPLDSAIM